jgi:diacylglycerol kinase (ATP)
MKSKWVQSFNNAIDGLIFVFKTQRSMKVHILFTLFVLLISVVLNVAFVDFLFLTFAMSLVLITEMINTALEMIMDMISESYHPLVRVSKDVSAGAVLISTLTALIVGYLIFAKYLSRPLFLGLGRVLESPWYITLIAILLVLVISISVKIFLGKGTPFQGGMPSAHSAIAFSIWTIVSGVSRSTLVMALTFLVAVMVAQSRVANGIHSIREVTMGAILGILVSILILQVAHLGYIP